MWTWQLIRVQSCTASSSAIHVPLSTSLIDCRRAPSLIRCVMVSDPITQICTAGKDKNEKRNINTKLVLGSAENVTILLATDGFQFLTLSI
ncbi:unnamed protein product [Musa acuminata var. zebrina]